MRRIIPMAVCAAAVLTPMGFDLTTAGPRQNPAVKRRMSFHNRILLNRAVLSGLQSVEVLLLVKGGPEGLQHTGASSEAASAVANAGGRVLETEAAIGYLRVEVAPERLLELVASPGIETYQISSLSRGAWYRDGPPAANAEMYRSYEVTPVAATEPPDNYSPLPALTPTEARDAGFTADNDVGVGEWSRKHPTFDGRGVTIALLESALPAFTDPVFRTAKTLDGKEVPKIAGILNAIDPEYDDETRVRLDTKIVADKTWTRVGNRTYILPRPGAYRMGMLEIPAGGNVIHRFAVVEEESSRNTWIDSNGDASFQDETPLADVNESFDPRFLKLSAPRSAEVSFVMSRGRDPYVVHIYLGRSSHQTMTASVAAGNRSDTSLASGVAPNARLLFVRMNASADGLARVLEGFIQAAKHPDVDVLTSSTGLGLVPDTAADFVGLLFQRLTTVYRKPIVNGAGNFGLMLGHAHAHGGALSVGGTLSPATHAAFYGGRPLGRMIVHPWSAAGPAIDGAIKPDFLAPVERIAANPPWEADLEAVPENAPTRRVPPGYEISCCTSASSPYAAGVVALLISAARQSSVDWSVESLIRALRMTARPLPGFQAHQQGNGALDISAAWRELARPFDPPRIVASAGIVHPLAQYAARGHEGTGIIEFEGWSAGMKGSREIRLRRESGPARPVTYRLAWTADDGTFTTAPSVTLPLNETIPVRVNVDVTRPGAHSGLLTLHDPVTHVPVFRTQATLVVAERMDSSTGSVNVAGRVPLMEQHAHYLRVPEDAGAIAFELEVSRGVLQASVLQSHGLVSTYYMQTHPMDVFSVGPGTYRLLMPNPEPGTWTLRLKNVSVHFPAKLKLGPRDDQDAEYTLRMRVLDASIRTAARADGRVVLDLANEGSRISSPSIEARAGSLRSHHAAFRPDGLSHLIEIDVPANAAALSLQLRAEGTFTELFLYDCTTGLCFSYDVAFPAASSQNLLVRTPAPGRWVAAVNPAPFPLADGSFVLEEVITTGPPVRRASSTAREPGARWREIFEDPPASTTAPGRTPVVFFELLDADAERNEIEHPWNPHPNFVKLRDRPVAIATATYKR